MVICHKLKQQKIEAKTEKSSSHLLLFRHLEPAQVEAWLQFEAIISHSGKP